ncbi:helix-turn-helix transcriptional regulator [Wenzhouxiangella marina]|uniref:Uncharacterized protein n=1 Tax=Wenzhouxiangella marina TaxID=1579979 RepID=A0A0K0XZU7_9GAMM|nr:helix-turn-helix transcriptional regulator [Wenzhouxiangella marina]AKS43156.1 hypothetical protein WM2015_2799 [Wenzhouxiangella marina]MBB6087159.1 DNA-binding CsgD family transcriptional regulator [Wenzhouxiangella marina]
MRRDLDGWISETYASVFDPEAFFHQFQQLAERFDAPVCALHIERPGQKQLGFTCGVDLEAVASDYPHFDNLWLERGLPELMRDGITHDGHHTPLKEMQRTDYHRYLLKPLDLDHSMGVLCDARADGSFAMLSLSRSQRIGQFQDDELKRFKGLQPHLQAMVQMFGRACEIGQRISELRALMDRSIDGMLRLDADGRIVEANEQAEMFLEEEGFVRRGPRQRFELVDPLARRWLQSFTPSEAPAERILRDPEGSAALMIRIEAVPSGLPLADRRRPSFLVILKPLRPEVDGCAARLRELFDFTPREAELAIELARCFTLPEAAGRLGMRHETARSHLKRCFQKMGVAGQAELIAIIRDTLVVATRA